MKKEIIENAVMIYPEILQLDSLNSQEFSSSCIEQFTGTHPVIINLDGVNFIDSSGLGAILSVVRESHQRNIRICVCSASSSVKVLFKMVKLSQLIPIFDSKEEAIAWSREL